MCFNNHKIAYLCGAECGILVPFYDVKASCGLPTEQGDVPPEMIRVPGGDKSGQDSEKRVATNLTTLPIGDTPIPINGTRPLFWAQS